MMNTLIEYLDVGGTLVGSICDGFETKQTATSRSPAGVSTLTFQGGRERRVGVWARVKIVVVVSS